MSWLKQDTTEPGQHLRWPILKASPLSLAPPSISSSSSSRLSFRSALQSLQMWFVLYRLALWMTRRENLRGLTFFWICPRCGLWPERWNSRTITQIDCLLPSCFWRFSRGVGRRERWHTETIPHSGGEWGKADRRHSLLPQLPETSFARRCRPHVHAIPLSKYRGGNEEWCPPSITLLRTRLMALITSYYPSPSREPFIIWRDLWDHFLSGAFAAL